jgi:lysophospholipase L1-like esterase
MGDSLTEGADVPVGHTWSSLASNTLNINIMNQGIGGDTTQGMLSRFHPEVIAQKPDFVFIMGGTNDLWWGLEVNAVLGNIFSMVFQARHYGIASVIGGIASVIGLPMPVHTGAARKNDFSPPWDGYGQFAEKMAVLIEKMTACAQESEVAIVDLHRPFFDNRKKIREDLFLPDGLHPNKAGHLTISSTFVTGLQEQFKFHPLNL